MKTIITVIFAGILTYTGAQNSGCQLESGLHAMRYFEINDFFKGNWYATHVKDATKEAVCQKYKASRDNYDVKLEPEGDSKTQGATCPSTRISMVGSPGSFSFTCQQSNQNGGTAKSISFTVLWTIIETDYNDYALAYRCTRYSGNSNLSGNLVLLHRKKTADGTNAAKILTKHHLSLSNFKNLKC
uniref:Salivary lipocalin n=1 Tax=Triatoma infestans TaxID=30076 RepID=A6YPH0_TRIIF|nr:salivary lipocalin [Triatoma infestans]